MSEQNSREPLGVVEVDIDIENPDAAEEATEVELRAVTEMMYRERMAFPVYAASLAPGGVGCLYCFERPGAGEGHVVGVHEPQGVGGALLPIHYLLRDADGRTARIIIRAREGS
ncbi:MAG TPA: hypothetical protein VGI29_06825 [Candidatus Binataceae bacterium]|jgi:hypothetical protein